MTATVAVLGAMLGCGGAVLLLAWLLGGTPQTAVVPRSSTGLWTTLVDAARPSRAEGVRLGVGLVLGVAAAAWTGLVLLAVVVPVAVWGLPRLLGDPPQADVELLQALDRWVRSLAAMIGAGKSITDAVRASTRQAPAVLQPHLVTVVRRLDDRWAPADALTALADDLDHADADAVVASLVLAVRRGGTGATATLAALADTIQDRLRALREVETERAKPRIVVRQVTLVTLVVMGAALLVGRSYFAPYASPLGQVLLAVLLVAYVGAIAALRRMTVPRRRARILRGVAP